VQTIDLFPTLLSVAGVALPDQDGIALAELERRGGRDVVFTEHADRRGLALRDRRYRYVLRPGWRGAPAGPYLFDTAEDPGELRNIVAERAEEAARLHQLALEWEAAQRTAAAPEEVDLDAAERERLEVLGYLSPADE
jgi:arylsulfatase A-like enzyme